MLRFFDLQKLRLCLDLYAVVNNAGISGTIMYDDFLSIDDYIHVINVNMFGVIRVTKAFKGLIKKSR